MRRTLALFAVALASLAAAVVAAFLRPAARRDVPSPHPANGVASGALLLTARLDRLYLPQDREAQALLEVDLSGADGPGAPSRVPVNAVLILDRSGSMSGVKMDRAR